MTQSIGNRSHSPAALGHEFTVRLSTISTRRLLACGAVAGPLFLAVALIQALARPGYDLVRDPVSVLSNGSLGWIQIANFLVSGSLASAGAVGLRRALHGHAGGKWAPRLIAMLAAGLVADGIFRTDPTNGFPPGTPLDAPAIATWHGLLHQVFGSLSFLSLIAACFVLAHYFSRGGASRDAWASRAAGTLFTIGLLSAGAAATGLPLFIGVGIAWLWTAAVQARLLNRVDAPPGAGS